MNLLIYNNIANKVIRAIAEILQLMILCCQLLSFFLFLYSYCLKIIYLPTLNQKKSLWQLGKNNFELAGLNTAFQFTAAPVVNFRNLFLN